MSSRSRSRRVNKRRYQNDVGNTDVSANLWRPVAFQGRSNLAREKDEARSRNKLDNLQSPTKQVPSANRVSAIQLPIEARNHPKKNNVQLTSTQIYQPIGPRNSLVCDTTESTARRRAAHRERTIHRTRQDPFSTSQVSGPKPLRPEQLGATRRRLGASSPAATPWRIGCVLKLSE